MQHWRYTDPYPSVYKTHYANPNYSHMLINVLWTEDGLVENIELFEFHMEKLSKQLCDGDEENGQTM